MHKYVLLLNVGARPNKPYRPYQPLGAVLGLVSVFLHVHSCVAATTACRSRVHMWRSKLLQCQKKSNPVAFSAAFSWDSLPPLTFIHLCCRCHMSLLTMI